MDPTTLLMIVAMLAIFYFMIIRPENKRKKQAEEMRASIKKGERITTIGGMTGKVVQVNADTIVFETGEDRVRIEITKWGVQSTESMEAAMAQRQSGGFFGSRAAQQETPAAEEQPQEASASEPEPAPKEEKADFDPEIH